MGVLACNRADCENIMCNRYSPKHGYICDDCFEELINSPTYQSVTDFMESHKEEIPVPQICREYFEGVFPIIR